MSNRLLVLLVILGCSRSGLAMDLMDLYREAKANDAQYAAAQAQFGVMRERVPLAKAGTAPQIRLNAGSQTLRGSAHSAMSSSDLQQSYYNARVDFGNRARNSYLAQPVGVPR